MKEWFTTDCENGDLIPLNFDPLTNSALELNSNICNKSLCSMNCVENRCGSEFDDLKIKSPIVSLGVTDTEKQIHSTVLNDSVTAAFRTAYLHSALIDGSSLNMLNENKAKRTEINGKIKKTYSFLERRLEPTTALFLFAKKRRNQRYYYIGSPMRKSKKCTNLVKYRNLCDEPPLKKPLSKSMLLDKYKLKISKQSGSDSHHKDVNNSAQIEEVIQKEHKSLQDVMTASEYDKITEKLMVDMFEKHNNKNDPNSSNKVKYYIDQIVRELYDVKLTQNQSHPVKILFRCLLEYWLKNTSVETFKGSVKQVKSINKPSNNYFTKDQKLSSAFIDLVSRQTQYHGNDFEQRKKALKSSEKKRQPVKAVTESFEKERRIQELERLLKNTVYICETVRSSQSKEKDIKITKKLIDNLERFSKKSVTDLNDDKETDSSTEIPKIEETIKHLISETSMPPVVAKEFLGAYLDVLLNDHGESTNETSTSSIEDSNSQESPTCDVQTESVLKKVSKSISTVIKKPEQTKKSKDNEPKIKTPEKNQPVDPGQLYLKDILDKITTIFTKAHKSTSNSLPKDFKEKTKPGKLEIKEDKVMKDELGRLVTEYPGKNLISENHDDNSVVIDLSKYDLEHISMFSDPAIKGMMSITIKLKEKPSTFGEVKRTNLNLKFSQENSKPITQESSKGWVHRSTKNFLNRVPFDPKISFKNPYIDYDLNVTKKSFCLKPYLSSSDATSKAYCRIMHESEHSLDFSIRSSSSVDKVRTDKSFETNDETQSCYMMSSFKKSFIASKLQKKVRVNEMVSAKPSLTKGDVTAFEKPAPRIIDEKFILMLLENLALLSKSIPGLHKDINALYLKLKKKHEKVVKNSSNIQGVGLLGKIYNDENKIQTDDTETQFDANICPQNGCPAFSDFAGNTSSSVVRNCVHKSVSAYILPHETKSVEMQTGGIKQIINSKDSYRIHPERPNNPFEDLELLSFCPENEPSHLCLDLNSPRTILRSPNQTSNHIFKPCSCSTETSGIKLSSTHDIYKCVEQSTSHNYCHECSDKKKGLPKTTDGKDYEKAYTTSSRNKIQMIERAISIPNWCEKICTKDCAISTAIKCIIDPRDCQNFKFVAPKRNIAIIKEVSKRSKNERKPSPKLRQDLIKEIKLLSPSFKVSTPSQTDEQLIKYVRTKKIEKDFKVYQLFFCNKYEPTKSVSMTDSTLDGRSDELKTIYRCTSDPSYCSG